MVFYVTGAPNKLVGFSLRFLLNSGFPLGPVLPRETGEISTLEHKVKAITEIIEHLKPSTIILVGDNGEKTRHYRMYTYVTEELPALVNASFPVDANAAGIFGHSMGGHGALTIGLKRPGQFRSVSAFSPICAPMQCPWGLKAFTNYLGEDRSGWRAYDATELVNAGSRSSRILIDQGDADQFLTEQLRPHLVSDACEKAGQSLSLRMHAGYDHSYYFIQSFMADHIAHHAAILKA